MFICNPRRFYIGSCSNMKGLGSSVGWLAAWLGSSWQYC